MTFENMLIYINKGEEIFLISNNYKWDKHYRITFAFLLSSEFQQPPISMTPCKTIEGNVDLATISSMITTSLWNRPKHAKHISQLAYSLCPMSILCTSHGIVVITSPWHLWRFIKTKSLLQIERLNLRLSVFNKHVEQPIVGSKNVANKHYLQLSLSSRYPNTKMVPGEGYKNGLPNIIKTSNDTNLKHYSYRQFPSFCIP
jgi:hypothetical protein